MTIFIRDSWAHSRHKTITILGENFQHRDSSKKLMVGQDDRIETSMAYAVKHGGKFLAPTEKGTCKHCGRYKYEELSYYKIIGYPPSWRTHGKGRG